MDGKDWTDWVRMGKLNRYLFLEDNIYLLTDHEIIFK